MINKSSPLAEFINIWFYIRSPSVRSPIWKMYFSHLTPQARNQHHLPGVPCQERLWHYLSVASRVSYINTP
jgi:hypothetical protein